MGMMPLALYLKQMGYNVFGYDDNWRPLFRSLLEESGIQCLDAPVLPPEVTHVVHSSAIGQRHPLYTAALLRDIPWLRRGMFLAHLLKDKRVVAIVGSHGKTTTTAMLVHILRKSGFPCSYLLGGVFAHNAWPAAFYDPNSPWVIAEVDESDGTIDCFDPYFTVVVNLDLDHTTYYRSEHMLEDTFVRLFARTQKNVIVPYENLGLLKLCLQAKTPYKLVGSRYRVHSEPSAYYNVVGDACKVKVWGQFNVQNAILALCVAQELGANVPANDPLCDFLGVCRRQTWLLKTAHRAVFVDYAHHPSELAALLDALLKSDSPQPLCVVFQPHRYSRTQHYAEAFAEVLSQSTHTLLMPVYGAGEVPIPGGMTERVYQAMTLEARASTMLLPDDAAVVEYLKAHVPAGTVAFLGAGDIEALARQYVYQIHPVSSLKLQLSSESFLSEYEPLASKTTLGVGGKARFYAEPAHLDDLRLLLVRAQEEGMPWFVLGRGSNMLVADAGFNGLVMRLNKPYWQAVEPLEGGRLRVYGGARLKALVARACQLGLGGFEFLEGIPGTLGGALRMNAGAMGTWMFDRVESIDYLRPDGVLVQEPKSAFTVGYRSCPKLEKAIVISAVLCSTHTESSEGIQKLIHDYSSRRRASQPREASAGCMFKNPLPHRAGEIIDGLGLKGLRIGGAEVSRVHGNFIVNVDHSTSQDVMALVQEVRHHVFHKTGNLLEPEVLLLGAAWPEPFGLQHVEQAALKPKLGAEAG
jgi:UDP-N-acetylenolpyruvoylglucosamine reductase